MAVDWTTLPEPLWISIFQHLDVTSLLNTSETCRTFNDLMENRVLTDKLKLVFIIHPFNRKDINDVTSNVIDVCNRSIRKYKVVEFYYLNCQEDYNILPPNFWKLVTQKTIEIIRIFSDSVREIHLRNYHGMQTKECKSTFKNDPSFQIQYFTVNKGMKQEKENKTYIGLLELLKHSDTFDELYLTDVNNDSRMSQFDNMRVSKLGLTGRFSNQYEKFLLKQSNLRQLTAYTTHMFENNSLSKVKFSLSLMNLEGKWTNKENALNFIETQCELEFVRIKLDKDQYDINVLKHIINGNEHVMSLSVELEDCDSAFMEDIHQLEVNSYVKQLAFRCVPENPTLSAMFMKLFPFHMDLLSFRFFD